VGLHGRGHGAARQQTRLIPFLVQSCINNPRPSDHGLDGRATLVCGSPDAADLAASYGFGLAKNHAFVDGNKRAALLSVGLFLALNGFRLNAAQADATLTVMSVASGDIDEPAFARWIRANSVPR
jgi:death-on-curing protein